MTFLSSLEALLTGKVATEVEQVVETAAPSILGMIADPATAIATLANLCASEFARIEGIATTAAQSATTAVQNSTTAQQAAAAATDAIATVAQAVTTASSAPNTTPPVIDDTTVAGLAESVGALLLPKLQPAIDAVGFLAQHFPQLKADASTVVADVKAAV